MKRMDKCIKTHILELTPYFLLCKKEGFFVAPRVYGDARWKWRESSEEEVVPCLRQA